MLIYPLLECLVLIYQRERTGTPQSAAVAEVAPEVAAVAVQALQAEESRQLGVAGRLRGWAGGEAVGLHL